MDPGWTLLVATLLVMIAVVLLLIMPMPSNKVRGFVTRWTMGMWQNKTLRHGFCCIMALDAYYFVSLVGALKHPLSDAGLLTPVDTPETCEMRVALFRNERNAYITGFSLFTALVLRRLVDIQAKLHEARGSQKSDASGVPMGQPVAAVPLVGPSAGAGPAATQQKSHFD